MKRSPFLASNVIAYLTCALLMGTGCSGEPPDDDTGGAGGQSSASNGAGGQSVSSTASSTGSASSSGSGTPCTKTSKELACGESECGFKPDNCGSLYWCGSANFSVYCDNAGALLCLSSGGTPGHCAQKGEVLHLSDMDHFCPSGKQLLEGHAAGSYPVGACAVGTGICEPYAGTADLSLPAEATVACCTPCETP